MNEINTNEKTTTKQSRTTVNKDIKTDNTIKTTISNNQNIQSTIKNTTTDNKTKGTTVRNTQTTVKQDTTNNVIKSFDNNNQNTRTIILTTTITKKALKTSSITTWSDLETAITNANDGDTIKLNSGTLLIASSTITINKNINITGADQTVLISGDNKYQLFQIASTATVNINNITFTKGNATNGGAITNNGNLNVNNSAFTYNNATEGGAIANTGNISINNSTFTYNIATGYSGAINNNGNLNVNNSAFTYNNATLGGAIANTGNLTIDNSTFTYNNATEGGAIATNGNTSINNSTFTYNTATGYGGAIYNNHAQTDINNTNINYNNATIGGAIHNNYAQTDINNTNINYNNATYGGAIENDYSFLVIDSSNINGNNATLGGAISSYGYQQILKNTRTQLKLVAITIQPLSSEDIHSFIYLINSNITNNTATDGGAIYDYYTNSTIHNSIINNNIAINSGTICNDYSILNITKSILVNNSADNNASVIYSKNGNLTANYNIIVNNTVNDNIYEINATSTGNVISLDNNWWGQNDTNYVSSPYALGLTDYEGENLTSWLILNMTTTNPTIWTIGTPSTITASLTTAYNNKTESNSTIDGTLLHNNIPITFTNTTGTIKDPSTVLVDGIATTTYTPITGGSTIIVKSTVYVNSTSIKQIISQINTIVNATDVTGTVSSPITVTANVYDIYGNKITKGTVSFYDNNGNFLSKETISTDGTVKYTATYNTAGINVITLIYDGTDIYLTSTNTTTVTINKIPTNLATTVTPGTTTTDSKVKVAVTDKSGNTITTGTITVYANGVKLGDYPVSSDGTITFNKVFAPTGTYTITATYNENTVYYSSQTSATTYIPLTNTTINVVTTPDTTTTNTTFKINVTDQNGNTVTKGTITVYDENNIIVKTITITNTTSTFEKIVTPNGEHNYTYNYTDTTGIYNSSKTKDPFIVNTTDTNINATVIPGTTTTPSTIIANVTDIHNNTVLTGTVVFYNSTGDIIGNATVISGTANITYIFPVKGNNSIIVKYNDTTGIYTNSINTTNTNIPKTDVTITIPTKTGNHGEKIIITALITDVNNKLITNGTLNYYVNGTYIGTGNITNGISRINYTIANILMTGNNTITGVYNGNDVYNNGTGTGKLIVKDRILALIVVASPPAVAEDHITFVATVINTNGTIVNNGKIVFKFQGHTITDSNGKPIKIAVVNGTATLNYTVPDGISAHNYTITAVYGNANYTRLEANTSQIINKIKTNITINNAQQDRNNLIINATIFDKNNQNPNATNKISVKVNGLTIRNATNGTIFYVTNGQINLNLTTTFNETTIFKKIALVTGERYGYLSSRNGTDLNWTKIDTTTTVQSITAKVNDTVTLKANVVDKYGNSVTGGKVTFKINGQSIKNSTGEAILKTVINGTAKLIYKVPSSWAKDNLTLSVVYSGTETKFNPSQASTKLNITKKTVTPKTSVLNINKISVTNENYSFIKNRLTTNNVLIPSKTTNTINSITVKE